MVYFLTHKLRLDIRGVKSNRNIIPLESQNFYSVRKAVCNSVRKAVNTTRYDLPGNRQGGSHGGQYNVRECLAF